MNKKLSLLVCAAALAVTLAGCHQDADSSFANMNRADQAKAIAGDSAKQHAMAAQMAAQYSHKKP